MGTNKKKVSLYSALDQRGLFSQKTQFLFPHPNACLRVEYREIEMPQFPPKCSLWHSGFTSPQLHFVTLDGFPVRVVIPQDIQFNSRAFSFFYVFLFLGRPLFPLYLFLVTALSVPLFSTANTHFVLYGVNSSRIQFPGKKDLDPENAKYENVSFYFSSASSEKFITSFFLLIL